MAKILTIGSVTKDMFFPVDGGLILDTPEDLTSKRKIAFELGAKYDIKNRFETLGGCCVNVACGLARLGENVSSYVGIGDDDCGRWILNNIEREGIDSGNVVTINRIPSDLSAILVDDVTRERTIFSSHGASRIFEVETDKLDGFDWFFVGDLSGKWKENLEVILKKAKEDGVKIAFNPRQQMLHEDVSAVISSFSQCEVLFVNKDEAAEIVLGMKQDCSERELDDEIFLLKKIKESGVVKVIVTDGERGAWIYDGEEIFHAPAILSNETVDVTGAGDAFASGFLGSHLKGNQISQSLKWGIANSTNSIKKYGGQAGLLMEDEMKPAADKVSANLIDLR